MLHSAGLLSSIAPHRAARAAARNEIPKPTSAVAEPGSKSTRFRSGRGQVHRHPRRCPPPTAARRPSTCALPAAVESETPGPSSDVVVVVARG
eukprot:14015740-Alexandrium_andersonii.AAC.1